ncbi:MAG TPA: hypothetical protein DHV62_02640 [Elusimicrobia bacterium]|jgi:hypothetical protein|nr:hypothetical protein [Elusimicrobiota bacterium]
MKDEKYVSKLENVIKQMLTPLKDIPFNLVIEHLTGKKVIPFNANNPEDEELLEVLKKVALKAGKKINEDGIISARANEVGNYIENFVKSALSEYHLNPDVPAGKSGKKKAMGYPDIIFYYKNKPYYLECKTYNQVNIGTTQRSFYFSPSEEFKVIYDTHHFVISYEMYISGRKDNKNIYKCNHWKILSLESLSLDVKHEFNSDNQRMYSGKDGAILLAEGGV